MTTRSWQEMCPLGRPFIKMQGLENHFVIVDGRAIPYQPTPQQVVNICNVRTGIGGDQLLVIESATAAGQAQGANAFLRIINVDGADVEACGNATRCVAWLLLEETKQDLILLETLAGVLECRRTGDCEVSVNMGEISMAWATIPLSQELDTLNLNIESGPLRDPVVLNIGNPHAIFFVDDLAKIDMEKYAPAIQTHPFFPQQINVGAVQVITDSHILLSVYERPGILTAACGSGACVSVAAAIARGLTSKNKLTVEMAAGKVEIEILADNSAVMTGPVSWCFQGNLPQS